MDLHLAAGGNGVDAIRAIRGEFPEARIIVLSAYTGDEEIYLTGKPVPSPIFSRTLWVTT